MFDRSHDPSTEHRCRITLLPGDGSYAQTFVRGWLSKLAWTLYSIPSLFFWVQTKCILGDLLARECWRRRGKWPNIMISTCRASEIRKTTAAKNPKGPCRQSMVAAEVFCSARSQRRSVSAATMPRNSGYRSGCRGSSRLSTRRLPESARLSEPEESSLIVASKASEQMNSQVLTAA